MLAMVIVILVTFTSPDSDKHGFTQTDKLA